MVGAVRLVAFEITSDSDPSQQPFSINTGVAPAAGYFHLFPFAQVLRLRNPSRIVLRVSLVFVKERPNKCSPDSLKSSPTRLLPDNERETDGAANTVLAEQAHPPSFNQDRSMVALLA
jgi:hypothetical protein